MMLCYTCAQTKGAQITGNRFDVTGLCESCDEAKNLIATQPLVEHQGSDSQSGWREELFVQPLRQVPDWDDWFLELAAVTAKRSKDPSRQVGCVIVHPDFKDQRAGGYNGMVAGVAETPEVWQRPHKYDYVCHAEANAVAIAARNGSSLNGCTAYITCFPCLACSRLLIQAGIKRVVVTPGQIASGYVKEFEKALELLRQAKVEVRYNVTIP